MAQATAPDESSANTEALHASRHTTTKVSLAVEFVLSVNSETIGDKGDDESGTLNQIAFDSKGFISRAFN